MRISDWSSDVCSSDLFEDSGETTRTIGYTLASDGTDDYISVDIAKPDDGGFVFRTLGGATACPYEGEEVTQYYNPGTVINVANQRIEVPDLTEDQAVVQDRKSVASGKRVSVRVDLGGHRIIKNKNKNH